MRYKRRMAKKEQHTRIHLVAAALLGLGALVHALRLLLGWQLIMGGWEAPMWLSGLGVMLAGSLAYLLWRDA